MTVRRRSPCWARRWSSEQLHAVCMKLRHLAFTQGISEPQEWLWSSLISELEYRRRRALREGATACVCEWCLGPFS